MCVAQIMFLCGFCIKEPIALAFRERLPLINLVTLNIVSFGLFSAIGENVLLNLKTLRDQPI
jgi:hypothetical protein